MKPILFTLLMLPAVASGADRWLFFPMDNGVGRGKWTPEEQAAIVKDAGLAGISYAGCADLPRRLKAFDDAGLKIFGLYVNAKVSPQGPSYDPGLPEAIRMLKGRDTFIWLTITGKAADGDAQATKVVKELAQFAEASDLRIALYPHAGFYVEKTQDAVRIAKLVGRKNVGVTFNLCHFLKCDKPQNMETVIKEAAPMLFMASINGADQGTDWKALIQPLDRGEFDTLQVLKILQAVDFKGPVGLQCYQVPGDQKDNLKRAQAAWAKLMGRLDER